MSPASSRLDRLLAALSLAAYRTLKSSPRRRATWISFGGNFSILTLPSPQPASEPLLALSWRGLSQLNGVWTWQFLPNSKRNCKKRAQVKHTKSSKMNDFGAPYRQTLFHSLHEHSPCVLKDPKFHRLRGSAAPWEGGGSGPGVEGFWWNSLVHPNLLRPNQHNLGSGLLEHGCWPGCDTTRRGRL